MSRDKITIHGWVARDGEQPNGDKPGLVLYSAPPRRLKDWPSWTVGGRLDHYMNLPAEAFPGLAWEDDPMDVEVTIRPARGLTEFETELADIIHSWGTPDESPFNVPKVLKADAVRLLETAREEGLL